MSSLRPSFAERDAFRDLLAASYADGRLDEAEFGSRQELLEQATTVGDLLAVADGLPTDGISLPQVRRAIPTTATPKRRWNPRLMAVAAAVALIVGFAAGGGFGFLAGADTPDSRPSGGQPPEPAVRPLQPGGMAPVIDWLGEHDYNRIVDMTLHEEMVYVQAIVPGSDRKTDRITWTTEPEPEVEPSGLLSEEGTETFPLRALAYSSLPAMTAAAPSMLDSTSDQLHLVIRRTAAFGFRAYEDEPVQVTVYVTGDDYGDGGGRVMWSGDGQELLQVSRA